MKKLLLFAAICGIAVSSTQARISKRAWREQKGAELRAQNARIAAMSEKEKQAHLAKQQAIYNRVKPRLLNPINPVVAETEIVVEETANDADVVAAAAEMVAEDTADALVSE